MREYIRSFFDNENIEYYAVLDYEKQREINPSIAARVGFKPKSIILFLLPYYVSRPENISIYSSSLDYHIEIRRVTDALAEHLRARFPEASFRGFGDHSPINEKIAAAKGGLGIIGEHSLLITPNYSSFVFLFEIITDIECDAIAHEVKYCEKCAKCQAACPSDISDKKICLSALTQKKGVLTNDEVFLIKKSSCAWGCDICQEVCPHTISAKKRGTIYTNNSWFNSNVLNRPSEETVAHISDFNSRAYSWRGSATILRNLNIINSDENGESK
jgi:epoxyqueuosine reductase